MNIPKTYDEFLRTPKNELEKIMASELSISEANILISFCRKYGEEPDQHNLHTIKESNNTLADC